MNTLFIMPDESVKAKKAPQQFALFYTHNGENYLYKSKKRKNHDDNAFEFFPRSELGKRKPKAYKTYGAATIRAAQLNRMRNKTGDDKDIIVRVIAIDLI